MNTTNAALKLVNVTLEYPDGDTGTLKALDEVSLKAVAGTVTSLVGPSGSGKSSLLAVAATLVRPSNGLVMIDGVDVAALRDKDRTQLRRDKVGIIFQPATQPAAIADRRRTTGHRRTSARRFPEGSHAPRA